MLSVFASIMRGLNVYPENMKRNVELTQGIIFSQRVLLALISRGLPRERAYRIVQDNAMDAWEKKKSFLSLLEADKRITALLEKKELNSLFDYDYYLRHVDEVFERLGLTKTRREKKPGKAGSTNPTRKALL
jgi:adenylosuccinate lyase